MSKQALIGQISDKFDSGAQAERAIDAVFEGVTALVKNGESVNIRGFGTIKPKVRNARKGRNPRTGEEISIAARTVMVLDSKVAL